MSLLSRLAVQAARAYGILSSKSTNVSASYLVVAGGGGAAGGASGVGGGGGGAGGYLTSTATLSTLNTYSITVGAGGSGGNGTTGVAGSNSVLSGTGITTITATGGGYGQVYPSGLPGGNGGSGGGGSYNGTAGGTATASPTQGNNGGAGSTSASSGSGAGGGGGASAVGGTGSGTTAGGGGNGTSSSISGSSVTYAGGGGGSGSVAGAGGTGGGATAGTWPSGTGNAGTANLGGGGGGGGNGYFGGAGGSGIVIISYTSATPKFVGGTLTTSGGNQIHTFTSSGTLSPLTPVTASYLVVAGGGGGGYEDGGGGGAGGLLTGSTTLYYPATYTVTVGAGGIASSFQVRGGAGGDSVLSGTGLTTLTSTGGGGGGSADGSQTTGGAGGSGGGGGSSTTVTGGAGTSGQGYAGGSGYIRVASLSEGGGGGGGSSAVGSNAASYVGGNGGAGTSSSISGSSVTYAGGGGGGTASSASGTAGTGGAGGGGNGSKTGTGSNGTANTGGGAGGSGGNTGSNGGAGGSGTVIISYAGSQVFNGGLVTSSGGNTIHTFNATGALTPLTNNLNNSLRFRSSASASLSRTPTVAGSKTTWTWSAWVKRGAISATSSIFSAGSGANITELFFTGGNILRFYDYISSAYATNLETTQLFRDPSAWYHITVVYDTTQATAANRVRLYVNGNQVTSFGSTTYPAQNYASGIMNSTTASAIGGNAGTGYFDGYLTDINFIDSQALEPYYFGNNDAYGNWKPILYKGTYGTNGFYLTFADTSALTTSSNAGLGKDTSGNGNYWATNNISITAGTTYDAMTDVPTNTSATVANYATLNPILQNSWWAAVNRGTIQDGNLTFATGASVTAFSNFDLVGNSGKWYYEMTCSATDAANAIVIGAQSRSTFETAYYQNGNKQINGATPAAYGSSWTSGDVIGVAIDVPNNNITFYKNNTSQGVINNAFPTGQPVYVGAYYNTSSGSYAFNFGQRPFSYTPPSGYVAMNTYNLSTPTILQGNLYMDATLYTGTGTSLVTVNAGQFKPDFVWIKARNDTQYHVLQNSNTGAGKTLFSNTSGAETGNAGDFISSFNSNGFTVNTTYLGGTNDTVDKLNNTYVGWQWQAGQGSSSSNTSGSITSTTSVNATAGFSVVTYTGNGTAGATVGHGLGVTPKMFIVKRRSGVASWTTYHASVGNTKAYFLNQADTGDTYVGYFNNTSPTSSVFSVGIDVSVNSSGSTYVAYCWAEIAGFSKFGSYTGNGSTDGPFVYCGFRPKFIMIKSTGTANDWMIFDSARPSYNLTNLVLYADLSLAEGTGTIYDVIDILSNGFKIRGSNNAVNASGTLIFMAFAENPFKNSNAR